MYFHLRLFSKIRFSGREIPFCTILFFFDSLFPSCTDTDAFRFPQVIVQLVFRYRQIARLRNETPIRVRETKSSARSANPDPFKMIIRKIRIK